MDIVEELKAYILDELLFDRDDIILESDDPILEKKIIDSMALVQLVSFMEDQYGIPVEDDEYLIENFKTIRHMKDFILRKIQPA